MTEKGLKQTKEIKALMAGYISGSLRLLGQQPLPGGAAIHDIRVMMKKHRAAVRLVRPLLSEAVYKREYLAGRETGRILASWRETDVMRKTVKALKKDNPELFLKLRDNEKIRNLLRKPYSNWAEASLQAKTVMEVADQLTRAKQRLRFIGLKEPDLHLLLGELDRSYSAAATAYLACRNKSIPRRIHEFRKKAKTFMYQLDYFRYLNPSSVKLLEKELDTMTRNLGRYNDLVQVMIMTGYTSGAQDNSDADNELAMIIRDRQDEYMMRVWPVANRLFTPGRKLQDILDIFL